MTTDELRDLLLQGGNHCSVYLGENFEDAKAVTEQLLALGFPHGESNYSRKVCDSYHKPDYGMDGSFRWHYAHISSIGIHSAAGSNTTTI
jgi:hypothetical protein